MPPDVPVCEELTGKVTTDPVTGHVVMKASPACMEAIGETKCGHCVYIVSGRDIFVGEKKETHFAGKSWSQLKRESVLVPAEESYARIAAYMINACKKMKCSDDVNRFRVRLNSLSLTAVPE